MTAAYKLHRTSSTSVRSDWLLLPGLLLRFFTVATAVSPITATAVRTTKSPPPAQHSVRNVHARGTCIVRTTLASCPPQDLPLPRYS